MPPVADALSNGFDINFVDTSVDTALSIGLFIISTFTVASVVSPACRILLSIDCVTLKYSGFEFVISSEMSAPILFELFFTKYVAWA